jgi:hypothetical protein
MAHFWYWVPGHFTRSSVPHIDLNQYTDPNWNRQILILRHIFRVSRHFMYQKPNRKSRTPLLRHQEESLREEAAYSKAGHAVINWTAVSTVYIYTVTLTRDNIDAIRSPFKVLSCSIKKWNRYFFFFFFLIWWTRDSRLFLFKINVKLWSL